MSTLAEIETPALLLDAQKMDRNIARMREHLAGLGVAFRPHVKTPKAIDVVKRMISTPSGPITVSTLKEAEYFFSHGITDILYAVGITPNKLDHVLRLMRAGCDLKIILDNEDAARAVVAKSIEAGLAKGGESSSAKDHTSGSAKSHEPGASKDRESGFAKGHESGFTKGHESGFAFKVLIEIDCDGHRSGVKPDAPELLTIGKLLHEGGAQLMGVLTHAGSSYNCRSIEAIRAMAEQERSLSVHCAQRLRNAGLPCPVVSIGSTPTATYATDLSGITEVRAGVFVFFDLVMAGIDVCKVDDIALSVLTTVIGHQRDRGWIITDAGWMAMSRDRGTAKQPLDQGYGVVCDAHGTPILDLIMADANQEHGVLAHRSGDPAKTPELPVGTLLRILPNHACATGAQHDRYNVLAGSDAQEISATWQRFSGW